MPFRISDSIFDQAQLKPLTRQEIVKLSRGDVVALDLLVNSIEMDSPSQDDIKSPEVQKAVKAAISEEIEIGSSTYFVRLIKLFDLNNSFLESEQIQDAGRKRIARELSAGLIDIAKIVAAALKLDEFLSAPIAIAALKKHLLALLSEVKKPDDFPAVVKFIKESHLSLDTINLAVNETVLKLKQNGQAQDADIITREYDSFRRNNL
jgi:hypothetical protein